MTIRIVVDMNLSVEWIPLLEQAGWPAVHWSAIGRGTSEKWRARPATVNHGVASPVDAL